MAMKLIVIGLNHKTAPVALRERLAFAANEIPSALAQLVALPTIQEGILVSTCNRVEAYCTASNTDQGKSDVALWLAKNHHLEIDDLHPHLYFHEGDQAIEHGFRVASSLDSLVVGETQVLGQLKQAYRDASEAKTTGPLLNKFFHTAFQIAKQVRTDTGIARNPVSIASTAVTLARKIFGRLEGHTCLLLGAGEMCELAARHMVSHGVNILVANRTLSRAESLAKQFNGQGYALQDLETILPKADILIASTGAALPLVQATMVHQALKQRRQRPQFYIDIAVPRDLDPAIGNVDNAFLYDIDDLMKIVSSNQDDRSKEMVAAQAIIQQAVPHFNQWLDSLEVVPTLVSLRKKLEGIRDAELKRTLSGWPDITPKEQQRLESMARLLINKTLHSPLSQLRHLSTEANGHLYVDAIRKLFELE